MRIKIPTIIGILTMMLVASCTRPASTPEEPVLITDTPVPPTMTSAPTHTPSPTPTRTPVPVTSTPSSTPYPTPIFADVPGKKMHIDFVEEYAALERNAVEWAYANNIMKECGKREDRLNFCPRESLIITEVITSLSSLDPEITEEIFTDQPLSAEVTRGQAAEVLRLRFNPDYKCSYSGIFPDVVEGSKYSCSIEYLAHSGYYIIADLPAEFGQDYAVDRGQWSVWLYLHSGRRFQ